LVFGILKIFFGEGRSNKEQKNEEYMRELENIKLVIKKQQELRDKDYNELIEGIHYLNNEIQKLKNSNTEEEIKELRARIFDLENNSNSIDLSDIREAISEFGRKTIENTKNIALLNQKIEKILNENTPTLKKEPKPIKESFSESDELSFSEEQILFELYNTQADTSKRAIVLTDLANIIYKDSSTAKTSYLSRKTSKLKKAGMVFKERKGKVVKIWLSDKGIEICRSYLVKKFEARIKNKNI